MRRTIIIFFLLSTPLVAEQSPRHELGFAPDKVYDAIDRDAINTFNGNLTISIPLGPSYPVSEHLGYAFALSYNSNAWDFEEIMGLPHATPSRLSNAGMGWLVSLGRIVPSGIATAPFAYEGPDGNHHNFWSSLHEEPPTPHPPSVASVSYSRDGTYLRLITWADGRRDVHFSDGTIRAFDPDGELTAIKDAFANTVTVTRVDTRPAECASTIGFVFAWEITDSQNARTNYVCFRSFSYPDSTYDGQVDRIVLATPAGGSASYVFGYTPTNVPRTCGALYDPNPVNVPLLTSITLPDGSQYLFTYYLAPPLNACEQGLLAQMRLPTKAFVDYTYRRFTIPAEPECDAQPYDTNVTGVATRIVSGPRIATATWTWSSSFTTTPGTIFCNGQPSAPPPEEMTVTATDPNGNVTEHFYSVWPGSTQIASPNNFEPGDYGAPFTRMPNTGSGGITLSRRIYDPPGYAANPRAPERSIFATYVRDGSCGTSAPSCLDRNQRVTAERTLYHDDEDRILTTFYTDFDGLGHFRRTQEVDFDGTITETYTAYNQREATVNPYPGFFDGFIESGTYPGSFTIPSITHWWILDTAPFTRVTRGTESTLRQTCYNPVSGFLRATRTRLSPVARNAADLLATYGTTSEGNLASETFHGGDLLQNAPANQTLCQIATAPPSGFDYQITHTYDWGVRSTSQYTGAPFLSLNRTIDQHTGFVTGTTDPSGHTTTFGYDGAFRLQTVTSPGVAPTGYFYFNATGVGPSFAPARVEERTTSTQGLGTIERHYQYDALGRWWREKRRQYNNAWSVRETTFDPAGNISISSELALLPATGNELDFHPPGTSFSGYDPFGRPAMRSAADGTVTAHTYFGDRVRNTTRSIGGTSVTTGEVYDRYGRLTTITENKDLDPMNGVEGELTTAYTYHVTGALQNVMIGAQQRSFQYDNRGLLRWEQHPELGENGNGLTQYGTCAEHPICQPGDTFTGTYDARGHSRRSITGTPLGPFDVTIEYDAAERATITKETVSPQRQLTRVVFDDPNGQYNGGCAGGACLGKISATERDHYQPDLGTIVVTETHWYDVAGRPTTRYRTLGTNPGETFSFAQQYNDLGRVSLQQYPCRVGAPDCNDRPTVTYGYTNGYLTSVASSATSLANITYHPTELVASVTHGAHPGATTESIVPDPFGMVRPCRILAHTSTVTITDNAALPCRKQVSGTPQWDTGTFTYDGSGNIARIGDTTNTTYQYDAFNRLNSWTDHAGDGGFVRIGREHDDHGNWLYSTYYACTAPGQQRRCSASSVAAAQLVGTTNHYAGTTYDAAGNVTVDRWKPDGQGGMVADRSFTYDAIGSLSRTLSGDRDFRFLYTYDGERVAVIERTTAPSGGAPDRITFFLRGFNNELLSTFRTNPGATNAAWQEDTFYRGAQLLANQHWSLGLRHYALDHLGSPRAIVNAAGQVGMQSFAPFGGGGSLDGGTLQFTGQERDIASVGDGSAQLPDYFHARYYEPSMGRFLSVDPGRDWDIHQPQSWNMYAYVRNNPINRVDPNGRQSIEALCENRPCGQIIKPTMEEARRDARNTVEAASGMGSGATTGERAMGGSVILLTLAKWIAPALLPGGAAAATEARTGVQANKAIGDAARDQLAAALTAEGRQVTTEVVKRTPFGPRRIDIEVADANGKVLGGIETKVNSSPYLPSQRAKDTWLKLVDDYIVNLVRLKF
jgi:RHS repeat-associated protein